MATRPTPYAADHASSRPRNPSALHDRRAGHVTARRIPPWSRHRQLLGGRRSARATPSAASNRAANFLLSPTRSVTVRNVSEACASLDVEGEPSRAFTVSAMDPVTPASPHRRRCQCGVGRRRARSPAGRGPIVLHECWARVSWYRVLAGEVHRGFDERDGFAPLRLLSLL
jgi:hypothetical protein